MKILALLLPAAGLYAQLNPATMPRVGTVDERFQSFNVEMVEVTGGRFWAPYKTANSPEAPAAAGESAVTGVFASAFRMRGPVDLTNARLRKLAAALGPSYVRVSGSWANSTYFHDSDEPAPATPPTGFAGILTRQQWRGVVDFSKAVDARIITSFTISGGVRDSNGLWTPGQAAKFLSFNKTVGGQIAAAEFFNEPTMASAAGAPKGYDAAAYGRDFKVFRQFAKEAAPGMLIAGPSSIGEGGLLPANMFTITSQDMLTATGPGVDVFSYHFYGAVSKRCAVMPNAPSTTPEAALSEEWLNRTERGEKIYAALRDKFEPGKPIWLSETGETACGGNPWASTFVDSFRYLNQLGRLAKDGVQVVAHNTLAASDYALLDESTLTPRPDYWAALMWRKMMGTTVLDAGASPAEPVHLYAHCLRGVPGGVALLAINADRNAAYQISIAQKSERYTLSAKELQSDTVELNGKPLQLGANDALPGIKGKSIAAGNVELAPATITFLAVRKAANQNCQ